MSDINKSSTPPPAYTPSASSSNGMNPNYGGLGVGSSSASTPSQFDPQNPYHNPWSSVPVFTHGPHSNQHQPLFHSPPPGAASHSQHWQSQAGPTPSGQLHIPYAYYDPRSEHSVMQADARARWRFFEAFAWVVGIWLVVGLILQGVFDGGFRFEWGTN